MATPIRTVTEIDEFLESFICTVHATLSAVSSDTDWERVNRFKLYLLTAAVPITMISHGLRLEPEQHVDTMGTSSEVCKGILMDIILKVQFLKYLPKFHRVLQLLNRFISEKLHKIGSKLEAYLQMTDFYTTACQYEC